MASAATQRLYRARRAALLAADVYADSLVPVDDGNVSTALLLREERKAGLHAAVEQWARAIVLLTMEQLTRE